MKGFYAKNMISSPQKKLFRCENMRTGGNKHGFLLAKAIEKIVAEHYADIHQITFEKGFGEEQRTMTFEISIGFQTLHKAESIPDAFVRMRKQRESRDEKGNRRDLKNYMIEVETNPKNLENNAKKMLQYSVMRSTKIAMRLILVVEKGTPVSKKLRKVFHEVWEFEVPKGRENDL